MAFHQPGRFQGLADGLEHFRRFEGLELVVEGPALRGLDGRVGRALAGHDDDGQRRLNLPDLGQGVQTVHAGQTDVQNNQIKFRVFQAPHGLFGPAHADDLVSSDG